MTTYLKSLLHNLVLVCLSMACLCNPLKSLGATDPEHDFSGYITQENFRSMFFTMASLTGTQKQALIDAQLPIDHPWQVISVDQTPGAINTPHN